MSHLVPGESFGTVELDRPFSCFDYVDSNFSGSAPIRKLFSIARCRDARTMVVEGIPATGGIERGCKALISERLLELL